MGRRFFGKCGRPYEKTKTYSVYDANGNKVNFKEGSEYTFGVLADMVVNKYIFEVTKQNMHTDGNFTTRVEYDKTTSPADPSYDSSDWPYTSYYRVAAVINNQVKGKIEVTKEGEVLTGFNEKRKNGYTIFTPVFEKVGALKDVVFGIYAAEDIVLKDGSEGPKMFDAATDEEILIPKNHSANLSNATETITVFDSKLKTPKTYTAENFDYGALSHNSGAELWYMLEREASLGNIKRTLYVTPEQKDTTYSYSYTQTDGEYNYRWDVLVILQSQAGGRNVTEVKITKTTEFANGYTDEIPLTVMSGSVGTKTFDPIQNYMPILDPTDWSTTSKLESYDKTYIFEADGKVEEYSDGTLYEDNMYNFADETEVDLAQHTPDRYTVRHYDHYKLTAADVKDETRVVRQEVLTTPGVDGNDDGDFDDPEDTAPVYATQDVNVTKKAFEWAEDVTLINPAAGSKAIYQDAEGEYHTAVLGFNQAGKYTSLVTTEKYVFAEADENGDYKVEYMIPADWSLVPFTGSIISDPHYIIITQTDPVTGTSVYRVLLNDLTNWQECTADGNFEKAVVQVCEVKYTQEANDPDGFTASWDGFSIHSVRDIATDTASAVITKHADAPADETVDIGLGWEHEDKGSEIIFNTIPITAPIYFLESDGIRTEMYYKGGVAYTHITLPKDAVDHMYEHIVPTLNFIHQDAEGEEVSLVLDWYSDLSPTNTAVEFNERNGLPDGVSVIAKRYDSTEVGVPTYYTLDIVTNQTEEAPLEITFADEYKMRIYTAETAAGNGVGIIDLYNVYKTTVYQQSQLIETITSLEDGKAHSSRLPLGSYAVLEISSDDNFVHSEKAEKVELKYKDQFTPVVWGGADFSNTYVETEIDVSKVFETAFRSDAYQPPKQGQEVIFGLYSGQTITGTGAVSVDKAKIAADTLIDVLKISYQDGGVNLLSLKLPEGNYYLKEIKAPAAYIMSPLKYNFVVREDEADYSAPAEIDFVADDGIFGRFILEKKGHTETIIKVENRLPMPQITVNGKVYALDANCQEANLKVEVQSDFTTVTAKTVKGETLNVTLPNGKVISMSPGDNTIDYTIDGVPATYVPTITYTGYDAEYEEPWQQKKGEDLTTYNAEFTLTGAGTDKAGVIVSAQITHTPTKTVTTKEELIDPDQPELGYHEVTVETGDLSSDGYQLFEHKAIITAVDSLGQNVINSNITRIKDAGTAQEVPDPVNPSVVLNARETVIFTTVTGAVVTVKMNEYGIVNARIQNTLSSGIADSDNSTVTTTGAFGADEFNFAKNVTLGRSDTSADKLMIKINSDGTDAFAVENNHKPEVTFEKVDKFNPEKKLSGARFEIWTAIYVAPSEYTTGSRIGTYTTGSNGQFKATLDYGVLFYKEINAPYGYIADGEFNEFRVVRGLDTYKIIVENEPGETPLEPSTPSTPSKPSIGTTAAGPDGEKEIIAKKQNTVVDTVKYADLTPDFKYTLEGRLIDKSTGDVVASAGKTFTPNKASGSVKVTFTFNGKKHEEKELVVFEYLYLGGELVASHADLSDKGQTVKICEDEEGETSEESKEETRKKAKVPKTGDNSKVEFWMMVMMLSLLAFLMTGNKYLHRDIILTRCKGNDENHLTNNISLKSHNF